MGTLFTTEREIYFNRKSNNMTYKVGDILVNKYGTKRKVLAVCGEIVAVSEDPEHYMFDYWATEKELNDYGYTLEAKPWEPEEKKIYWFIKSTLEAEDDHWFNTSTHKLRRDGLGVFPTKEAAESRIMEIKKLLGK